MPHSAWNRRELLAICPAAAAAVAAGVVESKCVECPTKAVLACYVAYLNREREAVIKAIFPDAVPTPVHWNPPDAPVRETDMSVEALERRARAAVAA